MYTLTSLSKYLHIFYDTTFHLISPCLTMHLLSCPSPSLLIFLFLSSAVLVSLHFSPYLSLMLSLSPALSLSFYSVNFVSVCLYLSYYLVFNLPSIYFGFVHWHELGWYHLMYGCRPSPSINIQFTLVGLSTGRLREPMH